MDAEHTARHFREESWLPALLDPRPPLAWAEDPTDMIARARARAIEMEATADNQSPLSAAQRGSIEALLEEADREADRGGGPGNGPGGRAPLSRPGSPAAKKPGHRGYV